jgi:thiamine-phosphate pyrophosphorylase
LNLELPKLYPITDTQISGLSHAEQVLRLCEGGATFIQLREKQKTAREFYEEAKAALFIARERNIKLIINDRVDIALALKADGVHLGQDDMPPEAARKILGDKAIIGFSTHNTRQAIEAIKMPVDYIAIGPIFGTTTKENPDPIVGLEGLRRVRDEINDFPLVAIGGINQKNFSEVLSGGANSVALISALLEMPDEIAERTRLLSIRQKRDR